MERHCLLSNRYQGAKREISLAGMISALIAIREGIGHTNANRRKGDNRGVGHMGEGGDIRKMKKSVYIV